MGVFKELVQSNKIAGPRKRSFTLENWRGALHAMSEVDEEDRNLFIAGVAVHEKLENIRRRVKLASSQYLSAPTKLRAFVGASNYNFLLVQEQTRSAIEQAAASLEKQSLEGLRLERLAAVKLKLPGGFEWTPEEIAESLVDGIEMPIQIALQSSPDLAGRPRMSEVVWSDIALEMNLGISYRLAEDLWEDCLWNDYKVEDGGRTKVFVPRDEQLVRGHCMGLARRQSLAMTFALLATKFHRALCVSGVPRRLREVSSVERQGKRQTIKFSKSQASSSASELLTALRGFASEPYYAGLLVEPLVGLGGLTLSDLLDAWVILSQVSMLLVEEQRAKSKHLVAGEAPAKNWLSEYVSPLQVNALVEAITAAAGIMPGDARRLIEFLTFSGAPRQEIWSQSLVPIGKGAVAPVFAAIVSPNLRRLLDVWLNQLDVDLSKRGPVFEAHIRATVCEAIRSSPMLKGCAVCIPDDYTFKPSRGANEQIDLLFVIGATVFVGEIKCVLEPTDAGSVARHRKTVEGAADQALRRTQLIERHRASFVTDSKRFGIEVPEDFKLAPLVVVSSATHVGVHAKGVPVVDELILERFFDGELQDVALYGHDLAVQKVVKRVFYSDAAEAEAIGQSYFASPPQMKPLLDGVRPRLIPIHAIDVNDWEGLSIVLECVLPYAVPTIDSHSTH